MAYQHQEAILQQAHYLVDQQQKQPQIHADQQLLEFIVTHLTNDESLKHAAKDLLNSSTFAKPDETSQNTPEATVTWTENKASLSIQEIYKICQNTLCDPDDFLDMTKMRPTHIKGITATQTNSELTALKNSPHKTWISCRTDIRATNDEERRCLYRQTDNKINWHETIKIFDNFQASRNYSQTARLHALQDLAIHVYPAFEENIRTKTIEHLVLYLKGFNIKKPDIVKYQEQLQTASRFPNQEFRSAFQEAETIYQKYRGNTISDTATTNTAHQTFDHGLFTFTFKCISAFCEPKFAEGLINKRDQELKLGNPINAQNYISAIVQRERLEANRPTGTMILGWTPDNNMTLNEVKINSINTTLQNLGINPSNLPPMDTDHHQYLYALSAQAANDTAVTQNPTTNESAAPHMNQTQKINYPTKHTSEQRPISPMKQILDKVRHENMRKHIVENELIAETTTHSQKRPAQTPPDDPNPQTLTNAIRQLNQVILPDELANPLKNIQITKDACIQQAPKAYSKIIDHQKDKIRSMQFRGDLSKTQIINNTLYNLEHSYPELDKQITNILTYSDSINKLLGTLPEQLTNLKNTSERQLRPTKVNTFNTNFRQQTPSPTKDNQQQYRQRSKSNEYNRATSNDRQRQYSSNEYYRANSNDRQRQYSNNEYKNTNRSRQEQYNSNRNRNNSNPRNTSYTHNNSNNRQPRNNTRSPYNNRNTYNNKPNNYNRDRSTSYNNYRKTPYYKDNRSPSYNNQQSYDNRRDSKPYRPRQSESRERSIETRRKYPALRRGYNAPQDYDPTKQKYCIKCSKYPKFDHHMQDCLKYDKINENPCTICNKGFHMDQECKNKQVTYTQDLN